MSEKKIQTTKDIKSPEPPAPAPENEQDDKRSKPPVAETVGAPPMTQEDIDRIITDRRDLNKLPG